MLAALEARSGESGRGRHQKSEVRSQKSEVRYRTSDVGHRTSAVSAGTSVSSRLESTVERGGRPLSSGCVCPPWIAAMIACTRSSNRSFEKYSTPGIGRVRSGLEEVKLAMTAS